MLADVRWYMDGRSGREAYERGHLPGAVFVDLDEWLAAPPSAAAGRHPLPDPEVFATGMSRLGISNTTTVIAYDDAGGVIAARLVWMLRTLGGNAALLDGGLTAYDGVLETGTRHAASTEFSAIPWPASILATMEDVSAAVKAGVPVIDARPAERFRGDSEVVDARPGHIPGARSVPCRDNVDASGRFLPVPVLRETFASAGIVDGGPVIAYCGSGVTACHNLLALELAGLGTGRLYPGSWSQWAATDRPAATGS